MRKSLLAIALASCSLLPLLILLGCGGATTPGTSSTSEGGNGGGSSGGTGGTTGGGSGSNSNSACSGMSAGQGASLNGFRPFPASSAWNQDISASPVDSNSAEIINFIGPGVGLHPDFGSGLYNGSSMGIPYIVVDGSQSMVNIDFTAYGNESDPGPMPVPAAAPIEGYPNPGSGDRHVLVLITAPAFYTSSTAPIQIATAVGMRIPPPYGTWRMASSGPGRGLPPMPPDFPFSLD